MGKVSQWLGMPNNRHKLLFWGGCGGVLLAVFVWGASFGFSFLEWLTKWATGITALAATAIAAFTCLIELARDEDSDDN
jgi:hypothetical protein